MADKLILFFEINDLFDWEIVYSLFTKFILKPNFCFFSIFIGKNFLSTSLLVLLVFLNFKL